METDVSPHVDMGSTAPSDVGSYTVTATYHGDRDHSGSTSSPATTFSITPATSTTTVSDAGGVYTGSRFAASALATGVGGLHDTHSADFTFDYMETDVSPHVDMGSTAPSDVGSYTVTATYVGDLDHSASHVSSPATTFSITPATSTTTVSDAGGVYTGSRFAAERVGHGRGRLARHALPADFTFDYMETDVSPHVDMGSTAPSDVGSYTVTATYVGALYHSGSPSATRRRSASRRRPARRR